jgi:hypothetical protein
MSMAANETAGDDLTAGLLAARTPALSESTTCGEVFEWFLANPGVPAAAIIGSRSGEVLGLVNRFIFFARYARQYVPELFSRKSILKLANRNPLVVDAEVRVADLGATLLVENPEALIECFVVPGADEPRTAHAAECHHRLFRGAGHRDAGALG